MKIRLAFALCLALVLAPAAIAAGDGAALYKSKCAACHGPAGGGDTPMGKKLGAKSLASADVQKLTDEQLRDVVMKGKGKKMPSFKQLTPAQVTAVVAQIRTFAKK